MSTTAAPLARVCQAVQPVGRRLVRLGIAAGRPGVAQDAGVVRQRGDGADIGGAVGRLSQPLQPVRRDERVAVQQHHVASLRGADAGIGAGGEALRPVVAQQGDLPLADQAVQRGDQCGVGRTIVDDQDPRRASARKPARWRGRRRTTGPPSCTGMTTVAARRRPSAPTGRSGTGASARRADSETRRRRVGHGRSGRIGRRNAQRGGDMGACVGKRIKRAARHVLPVRSADVDRTARSPADRPWSGGTCAGGQAGRCRGTVTDSSTRDERLPRPLA